MFVSHKDAKYRKARNNNPRTPNPERSTLFNRVFVEILS
jgi:hypothetical protein